MTRLTIFWLPELRQSDAFIKKKKVKNSGALDPGTLIFAVRALAGSTRKWKHCIILAVEVSGVLRRIPKPHILHHIHAQPPCILPNCFVVEIRYNDNMKFVSETFCLQGKRLEIERVQKVAALQSPRAEHQAADVWLQNTTVSCVNS